MKGKFLPWLASQPGFTGRFQPRLVPQPAFTSGNSINHSGILTLLSGSTRVSRRVTQQEGLTRVASCSHVVIRELKATSHSTILDIPMRPLREDQKHRHRFTRSRRLATPVMVIIPLNFARCTLSTHRNR